MSEPVKPLSEEDVKSLPIIVAGGDIVISKSNMDRLLATLDAERTRRERAETVIRCVDELMAARSARWDAVSLEEFDRNACHAAEHAVDVARRAYTAARAAWLAAKGENQ